MGHVNKASEGCITGKELKKALPSFFIGLLLFLASPLQAYPKFTVFTKRLILSRTAQKIVCMQAHINICVCIRRH